MRMTGESPVAMRTRRAVGLGGEREALLIRARLPAEATMPLIVPPFVIHPDCLPVHWKRRPLQRRPLPRLRNVAPRRDPDSQAPSLPEGDPDSALRMSLPVGTLTKKIRYSLPFSPPPRLETVITDTYVCGSAPRPHLPSLHWIACPDNGET